MQNEIEAAESQKARSERAAVEAASEEEQARKLRDEGQDRLLEQVSQLQKLQNDIAEASQRGTSETEAAVAARREREAVAQELEEIRGEIQVLKSLNTYRVGWGREGLGKGPGK